MAAKRVAVVMLAMLETVSSARRVKHAEESQGSNSRSQKTSTWLWPASGHQHARHTSQHGQEVSSSEVIPGINVTLNGDVSIHVANHFYGDHPPMPSPNPSPVPGSCPWKYCSVFDYVEPDCALKGDELIHVCVASSPPSFSLTFDMVKEDMSLIDGCLGGQPNDYLECSFIAEMYEMVPPSDLSPLESQIDTYIALHMSAPSPNPSPVSCGWELCSVFDFTDADCVLKDDEVIHLCLAISPPELQLTFDMVKHDISLIDPCFPGSDPTMDCSFIGDFWNEFPPETQMQVHEYIATHMYSRSSQVKRPVAKSRAHKTVVAWPQWH